MKNVDPYNSGLRTDGNHPSILRRIVLVSAGWLILFLTKFFTGFNRSSLFDGVLHPLVTAFTSDYTNGTSQEIAPLLYSWMFFGYLCSMVVWVLPLRKQKIETFVNKHELLVISIAYLGFVLLIIHKFNHPGFFSAPIVQDDYIMHFVDGLEQRIHILNSGRLWGYDPLHTAGRLFFGIDNLWQTAFMIILRFTGDAAAFNISIVFSMLLPPILLYIAGRLYGLSIAGRLIFLVVSEFILLEMAPFRGFYYFGCVGFLLSTSLCFVTLILTMRYCAKPSAFRWVVMTGTGVLVLLLHPLSGVLFILLFIPFAIAQRVLVWRVFPSLIIGALVVLFVNTTWIIPYFLFAGELNSVGLFSMPILLNMQTQPDLVIKTILHNKAFALLVLMAVVSIVQSIYLGGLRENRGLLLAIPFIAFVAFMGSQMRLEALEPARFIIPLVILLLLVTVSFTTRNNGLPKPFFLFGFLLLCAILSPVKDSINFRYGYSQPIAKSIFHSVKTNVEQGHRILIQESSGQDWFNSRFAGALPWLIGREVTAQTYPLTQPQFPQFVDNRLFNRPIDSLTDSTMQAYFELYGVGCVITRDYATYSRMSRLTGMSVIFDSMGVCVMRYKTSATPRCIRGTAQVTAGIDRIKVSGLECDTLVLSYHYYRSLIVSPETAKLYSVKLLDDPIPFIGIISNGNKEIIISNGSSWPVLWSAFRARVGVR